jgi:hypothetical protein
VVARKKGLLYLCWSHPVVSSADAADAVMQVTSGESRARMGEVAHQRSDFVILSDSDPGLEDPREIIQVRGQQTQQDVLCC